MGWCSGTIYFDTAMDLFLHYVPKQKREETMYQWYKLIRDGDWDCVEESDYWEELKRILKKKEPEYWDFNEDEDFD